MIYLFLLLVSMAGWLVHITVLLHIVVCPLLLHIPWLVGSTLMGFMPILFYALLLVGSNCYASFYIFHALCLIAGWFYIASIALLPCDALDGLCPYWWFMPILLVYALMMLLWLLYGSTALWVHMCG